VGSTSAFVQLRPVVINPLAPCAVGGTGSGTTNGASATGFVSYGPGQSSCAVNPAGAATVDVKGTKFRLDGLRAYGGPIIKIASFAVNCTTTEDGSQSSIQVNGLSGITLPNPIPVNYTVTIPGAQLDAKPVAKIIVNEVVTPDPSDGSMTVTLMHVRLFPEGGHEDSGDVVIGKVSCSPNLDAG
jgi:hypothetical protein